jgi:AmmeMemoRadiSam system protein B
MSMPEYPRLRRHLAAARDPQQPNYFLLWDEMGLSAQRLRVSEQELDWLQQMDGHRTVAEIQNGTQHSANGPLPLLEVFTKLLRRLDDCLFLEGPRFREALASPVRLPSCLGCYPEEPTILRRQMDWLFTSPKGPGLPRAVNCNGQLRAALIPHIDYGRGGHTFAWGFKEIFERTDASLFVIIGTSHYSGERFTLTRKNFQTPLGLVPTDQGYIDRLVAHYGDGLFDDEVAHLPEHSIELEVVFLQYLYEGKRPFRIVPLVVGSFQDCVLNGSLPSERPDIGRMIEALRRVEAETKEPICYLISGDLAHIGPKFGDDDPVAEPCLTQSRVRDRSLLKEAETADPRGFFEVIAAEEDRRRICGLPPTYLVLEVARPSSGKLLHYDQYVHPHGFESVSFASVAFYQQ